MEGIFDAGILFVVILVAWFISQASRWAHLSVYVVIAIICYLRADYFDEIGKTTIASIGWTASFIFILYALFGWKEVEMDKKC